MNSKSTKVRNRVEVAAETAGGVHGVGWALNLIAHKKEN